MNLGVALTLASGAPYTLTTGLDPYHTGYGERPPGRGSPKQPRRPGLRGSGPAMVARLQFEQGEKGKGPRGHGGLRRIQRGEPRELLLLRRKHEFALLWKSRGDAAGAQAATIGETEVLNRREFGAPQPRFRSPGGPSHSVVRQLCYDRQRCYAPPFLSWPLSPLSAFRTRRLPRIYSGRFGLVPTVASTLARVRRHRLHREYQPELAAPKGFSFNYYWVRSDGAKGPVNVVRPSPSQNMLVVKEPWTLGAAGQHYDLSVKLFVNSGNTHLEQTSQVVSVTCK